MREQSFIRATFTIITAVLFLTGLPSQVWAQRAAGVDVPEQHGDFSSEFTNRAAAIWGDNNVWLPGPKVWVQYEDDLGERSLVDFEKGVATVQILIKATDNPRRELVRAHMHQGIGNLILGDPNDPYEMHKKRKPQKRQSYFQEDGSLAPLPPEKEVRVYLVQKQDSLWKIARRFHMLPQELAKLNGIAADTVLSVGLPLKVIIFASHDLRLDDKPRTPAKKSVLLDQIRMVDGSPVPQWLVQDFAREVMENDSFRAEKVVGADGIERLAVTVEFKLVSNHLESRARKYFPLVQVHAKKHDLDPALIMAIIHTESMFNPRARSRTPAFGLMQLVPRSGGTEAYRRVYGKKRQLTSQYLYDPNNNIELGVAYFNILKNTYMKKIVDPTSRTYCAVAAYNAGAANVGSAFVSKKSMIKAAPVINQLKPQEVYKRLVTTLPFKESRNYVDKVLGRIDLYQEWQ